MSKLEIIKTIVDNCDQDILVVEPIVKAEYISGCLNQELSAYGLTTYVSPDKSSVIINDEGMNTVLNYFEGTGFQPIITQEHVERIKNVLKIADKAKVPLIWSVEGFKRRYFQFKQMGFNGVNLYNVLNINTLNTAAAATSANGAVGLTIAVSWTGRLFLSTVENYIPNDFVKTKAVVKGSKFLIGLPLMMAEHTTNVIIGRIEMLLSGNELPINVTKHFNITEGPRLKDINKLKKPIIKFLRDKLDKYSEDN